MTIPAQAGSRDQAPGSGWGLVLGGGGVLGAAWMVGALAALQEVHGLDPREARYIVGTSAGSVNGALLGAGVSVEELRAHQLGEAATSGPLATLDWDYDTDTGGANPPRPHLHPGSAGMVTSNVARLRQLPPTAVLAALLPEGRGDLSAVGRLVRGIVPSGWCPHAGYRAVALDFGSGRRVAFGAPDAPPADLADAVMASCAIPGWYAPVKVGGRRYVDGGAHSSTNLDLLAGLGLAEVFVLAPMVSFAVDRPTHWRALAERQWRARVTRRCLREVATVHRSGTVVTVLGPGPEDLDAIGANLMAVDRRRHVLETALRTASLALADPERLPDLPPSTLEPTGEPQVPPSGTGSPPDPHAVVG